MVMLGQDNNQGVAGGGAVGSLEALLGPVGFPQLLDIPPDADDEAMVEFAIALSLQDHENHGLGAEVQGLAHEFQQGLANLQELQEGALQDLQALANEGLVQAQAAVQGQEAGHYSDTTASAAGSDDEGSTAATDGSTLRTSPAEQVI